MTLIRKVVSAWGRVALLALALLIPAPDPALAQSAKNIDSKKLDVIRERMEKGQALFVAGDYAGAAKVFEEGYAEQPYAAFLFNAGVCYQKLDDLDHALEKFRGYLAADPGAPDADKVKSRITALEAARAARVPAPAVSDAGGVDGGEADAGAADAAGTPPVVPPPGLLPDSAESMKSLAIVETDPPGAPIRLFARSSESTPAFQLGGANPGWKEVVAARSPANLTLEVGSYHVVVEPFLDYRACEADVEVKRAKVFHFRANLSQGAFMGFLRVSANVLGAYAFLDDDKRQKPPWGITPHGELVSSGAHSLVVEAPGFEPLYKKIELGHGEQKEITVKLVRVSYGYLRIDGSSPDLKIEVDGKPVGVWRAGEAPLSVKLDAGKHKLTMRSSGFKTLEQMVTVPRGQVLPVHAEMIGKYPRGAAWVQAAIGAVFLGAGTYLGLQSNQLHSELQDDRKKGVLEESDERIKRGRIYAIAADAGFAIGGVLAVLATYNFVKDPLPESRIHSDPPVEFYDSRKARPTATLAPRRRWAAPVRREPAHAPSFGWAPTFNGIGLGGTF